MTSVNAELYHREFDRNNERYARALEEQEHRRVCQDENATVVNDRWLCNCPKGPQ